MFDKDRDESRRHEYPPFWDKAVPIAVGLIVVIIVILLVVIVGVALGLFPGIR
jgi:uncharacterized membrane protein YidH (DUF202 family)